MRIPIPRPRLEARQLRIGLRVALMVLLAAGGALLTADRPGLHTEYFALGAPWEGKPFHTAVAEPQVESVSQIRETLMTEAIFSVRWRGWWAVAVGGEHRFVFEADDGGYLRIDDELVVRSRGGFSERRQTGRKALEPGFHRVEIGLFQIRAESRLAIDWIAPGTRVESAAPFPLADLYAGRPLGLRRALRGALAAWPQPYRRLLGAVLLLAAALLLRGFAAFFERPAAWLRARLRALDGRGLRAALLLGLFFLAFFASLPYTGAVRGGDDTAYLYAATFGERSWFFNRYAHVYLLKLFVTASGGDPFVGVRVWWSFVFATTVAALAVAVHSVGPGLQLRTLAATLFVLLGQTAVFGLIGAAYADFSAMMFVTLAVAVYMHGLARARDRPPPRHEWHALAIGALTVAAFRSKEVGAVLLLLPALFLIVDGQLDLRRFVRRMVYWTAGGFAVLLALSILDAAILGDFFFALDSGRLARSGSLNFPEQMAPRTDSWFDAVWRPWGDSADVSLRNIWVGVCAAALAAGLRRRRLELRLLHLVPIAYLVALIALYIGMPHPFSGRMLIPILPVACLMTGLLLHHAGLDDVPSKDLLAPGVLIPGALALAVVFWVAVPYRLGTLEPASLLPDVLSSRYGWEPDHFVVGVLLPVVVLAVLSWVAPVAGQRRVQVAALVVAFVAFFSVGFEITRASLAKRSAVQTGELLLYPWKTFDDELAASPFRKVALSRDLQWRLHMSATTRTSLARLALRRRDVHVVLAREQLPADADVAIGSRYAYSAWRQRAPALAATASFDPGGVLVLVRPQEAAEQAARLRREKSLEERLGERLGELRFNRDPEARDSLLQGLLDSKSIALRSLQGDRLRAVALSPDGWTHGSRPAGLIVENPDESASFPRVRLAVNAPPPDYPIRVFVDDGDGIETVLFDERGIRKVELRPVPPRSSRLFIIWSEKAWSPEGQDSRQLGVRVLGPAPE